MRKIYVSLLIILLVFLTITYFFEIYRTAAFNIIPHDDYAPYLLQLIGKPGGHVPESPHCYRIFSVAIAIPFYYLLPVIQFTNLEQSNLNHLLATEALSFTLYLAILITSLIIFLLTKNRLKCTSPVALTALFLTLLLFRFTALAGIDATAIMLVSLILYFYNNKPVYTALLLLSVGFNEKIVILFFLLAFARLIFNSQKSYFHSLVSILSFILYFLIILNFKIPGNENQLDPATYFYSLQTNIIETLTLKGFILNIIPTGLLVIFYAMAVLGKRGHTKGHSLYFTSADIAPLLGLFFIGHALQVHYNIGRIVMFSFPIYLPFAARFIHQLLEEQEGNM